MSINVDTRMAQSAETGTDQISEFEIFKTGSGNDTIFSKNASYFSVFTGAGSDSISVWHGDHLIDGGAGVDVFDVSDATSPVIAYLAVNRALTLGRYVQTLVNIENVIGGSGDDQLAGDAADNSLEGGAGRDILSGEGGNDTLFGGDGDDRLVASAGNDLLNGGSGTDTYNASTIASPVTVDLAAGTTTGAAIGSDTLTAIENAVGGFGDDMLIGDSATNRLEGSDGNDTLSGQGGDDTLKGGDGYDTFVASLGNDTIIGGAKSDVFDASASVNQVIVNLANGTATGADIGSDTLNGIERVVGGSAGDTVTGSSICNTFYGKDGNDTINGGGGADTLAGNDGDDILNGGLGADTLAGGTGADILDYDAVAESGVGAGNRDNVFYFHTGIDKFDMAGTGFTSYGGETNTFSAPNQLILDGDILKGSINGITTAFEIDMNGVTDLANGDFIF